MLIIVQYILEVVLLMIVSNCSDDMAYYSRDHLSQAIRKHGLRKAKVYLYSVIAILEKSIAIVQATEEVLPELQRDLANTYIQRLQTMLPELVKSVDSRGRYYPNNLIKASITEHVEEFNKLIGIDIMTHEFLTYRERITYILHNALMFIIQAMDIVKHISEDQYWEQFTNIMCNLIELIHPEFSDVSNESSVVYESMFRNLLKLRNSETPLYTPEWLGIALAVETDEMET